MLGSYVVTALNTTKTLFLADGTAHIDFTLSHTPWMPRSSRRRAAHDRLCNAGMARGDG